MLAKKKIIKLLLIISIGGSIASSSFLIFTLFSFTGSWSFNLTDNLMDCSSCCAISSDGKYIVVGSGNDYVYLFEKSSSTPRWSYRIDDTVVDVDISANGRYIVAGSIDGDFYVFERENSNPIWSYSASSRIVNVGISADANYIFFITTNNHELYFFNRDSDIPLWTKSFAGDVAVISGNGNYIVSIYGGSIMFYSKLSSTPLWQYNTGESFILALAITPNGEFFTAGGQAHKVHLFNRTGAIPFQVYSVDNTVRSLAISDDGNYISAGCSDGLYFFEKSNSSRLWRYLTTEGYQTSISSDGSIIAFGGITESWVQDNVYLFNNDSNNPLWEKILINNVRSIMISDDGSVLAVAAGFNFYLFNSNNPTIDTFYETKLIASIIGLTSFLGMGATIGVIHLISRRNQAQKEKVRLEKEKMQEEITGVIEKLDGKFKEWDEDESEKI